MATSVRFGLLLALLLMGAPAARAHARTPAALTPVEAESVRRVFSAATDHLHAGMSEVLVVIRVTDGASRPRAADVVRLLLRAQRQLASALGDLLGATYAPTDVRGRGFFVARAVQQIDAAKGTLAQVQAAASAAGGTQYTRLRTIWVANALTQLNAFNRTLPYLDPYPEGVSPQGRRLVIGPHGEYDQAQARLSSAINFLLLGYEATQRAYAADALLPGYEAIYQQMKFAALLYRQNVQAMATLAALPLTSPEAALDPFFRVLARLESLTHGGGGATTAANHCAGDTCHGTPYNYNQLVQFFIQQVPYWTGRPTFAAEQRELLHRITEAWDGTDSAVWFTLSFPQCDQVAAPTGCGGR
jgi:hypothetical protein